MTGPQPPTAAIRRAVRSVLESSPAFAAGPVLVACSGGADSLALAAATAFVTSRAGVRAGALVVDHGLQAGSREVAERAADQCRLLRLDPVEVLTVDVARTSPEGVEAAARTARYAALDAAAARLDAFVVLLGHTLDDQAEQVLLGLTRGSGARSLAGMPAARGRFHRPLLGISRAETRASCTAEGITWWEDPMNEDPAYTRVRARSAVADLERDLGPGVTAALARSADQLREDADALDALAEEAIATLGLGGDASLAFSWPVRAQLELPRAVRSRVWRRLLLAAGAPAGQVSARHTDACDRLLTHWHGQGPIHVPGHLRVTRSGGRVTIDRQPRVE